MTHSFKNYINITFHDSNGTTCVIYTFNLSKNAVHCNLEHISTVTGTIYHLYFGQSVPISIIIIRVVAMIVVMVIN